VTIEIGVEKIAFMIHEDLLVYYSDYFRGAFSGSFKEATEGRLAPPEEKVNVFKVFNNFIYTHQLCDGDGADLCWSVLIKVWLFGDRHIIPALQNEAMDSILAKNVKEKSIPSFSLKYIYRNTLDGSPLRKVMIDLVTYKGHLPIMMMSEKATLDWPHEALVDLTVALGAKKPENIGTFAMPADKEAKCYYHVHNEEDQC
jgi:hypothetical protein